MQAIERRDPADTRIPLDLWVRLNHEDYDADFDADGVDLSVGGLALRSDYLPEVGDRLRCRFDDPREASEIRVDGEVVWAHDAGERCGEFGLRFTSLGAPDEEGLRRLVEHLGGEPGGMRGIRLHLEGVATPIDADLIEEDERWLTVEQELPFLELGMGIASEGGARGRLASVDLRLEGGIPRLVLGVELDATQVPPATDTVDEVDEVDAAAEPATYDDEHLDAANDATMQDVMLPDALAVAALDAPVDEGREAQAVQVFEVGETQEEDEPPAIEAEIGTSKLAPLVAKAKAGALAAWAKSRPALATLWGKITTWVATVATHAGPGLRAFGAKVGTFAALLWGKIKKGRGKRRTTAAVPPKRVARAPRRRQQASAREEALPPRRKNRRVFALSILAFIAVGAIVYALTSGEDEPEVLTPPAATAPASTPAPAPAPAAPAPAPVVAAPAAPTPAAAPPAAPAEAAGPSPSAEEPAGGPLAEPSYPTLRDANPSGGGAVSAGQAFGADSVSEGRSATIRLSQPVSTLQGQAMDGGFTVTVPGALALDRAAPIAAVNPAVERAMILNRGDHAVLTVRFVSGRTPDYRVVARGRAIEVIIGR